MTQKYWNKVKKKTNVKRRKRLIEIKYQVFTHYSRSNIPICAWCDIIDIDMLCIDHVNNDGKTDRKENGFSFKLYNKLSKLIDSGNAPENYQILCYNHNIKKEVIRRQTKQIDADSLKN